jgi:hypothetical protein
MESRLNFCLDNQLISFLRRKNTNPNEILITIDILKEFRDADILPFKISQILQDCWGAI